jgi:general secretion pathway protein D
MFRYLYKTWRRALALWMAVSFMGSAVSAPGQMPPPGAVQGVPVAGRTLEPAPATTPSAPGAPGAESVAGEKLVSLNFRDAPLDQVLQFYSEITGRTLIKSPGLNATITLRGQTRLTQKEALQAIESVLAMNNVTLVPMGEKFLKVVQPTAARQEAMSIAGQLPEKPFEDTDQLVSQIIPLKYIEIAEAQALIQGFIHGYGKIQPLERSNSLLITDTSGNLQRIMEILEYVDQPTEIKVETRIYELKYAEAAKIASRLNELLGDSQAKEEKPRVANIAAPTMVPSPPGVIRARVPGIEAAQPEAAIEAALAERGIVQGKVKIIADDRTNILIVISRPSNFYFFDKIVAVLDRPVEPDVVVRVVALEYAKAEEIAGILNDFVGAAKSETKTAAPGAAAGAATAEPGQEGTAAGGGSQVLQDYITRQAAASDRLRQAVSEEKAKIGQLSANTKILADKRTNSLLLMGTKGDLAALEDVIDRLDTMLAQVLIESVILEINLTKNLEYGIDWLQRSMTVNSDTTAGPNGGAVVRKPVYAFGGGQNLNGTTFQGGDSIDRTTTLPSGLSYFTTIFDLNIDAVIRMAAGSSDAKILSTPVILTTDNTEAKIVVGEERPVVTSTSTSTAGQQTSAYEYRNIGINLTVTPRINPQRFVVMEITQTADNVAGSQIIDNNSVPIITKREMKAQIAVASRSTIALGGLVSNDRRKTRSKVPILGDIPIVGALFRKDTDNNNRTELLVLLTPYVLTTPEEAQRETERLHSSTAASQAKWYRGWSDSPLTRPSKALVNAEKRALAEAERQARLDEKVQKQDARRDRTKPQISVVVPSETQVESAEPVSEEPQDMTTSEPEESPASTTVSTPISAVDSETVQPEPATVIAPVAPVITPATEESDVEQAVPLRR